MAVAASMLTAAYYMTLRDDVDYHDLGGDDFDRLRARRAHGGHGEREIVFPKEAPHWPPHRV